MYSETFVNVTHESFVILLFSLRMICNNSGSSFIIGVNISLMTSNEKMNDYLYWFKHVFQALCIDNDLIQLLQNQICIPLGRLSRCCILQYVQTQIVTF